MLGRGAEGAMLMIIRVALVNIYTADPALTNDRAHNGLTPTSTLTKHTMAQLDLVSAATCTELCIMRQTSPMPDCVSFCQFKLKFSLHW